MCKLYYHRCALFTLIKVLKKNFYLLSTALAIIDIIKMKVPKNSAAKILPKLASGLFPPFKDRFKRLISICDHRANPPAIMDPINYLYNTSSFNIHESLSRDVKLLNATGIKRKKISTLYIKSFLDYILNNINNIIIFKLSHAKLLSLKSIKVKKI